MASLINIIIASIILAAIGISIAHRNFTNAWVSGLILIIMTMM